MNTPSRLSALLSVAGLLAASVPGPASAQDGVSAQALAQYLPRTMQAQAAAMARTYQNLLYQDIPDEVDEQHATERTDTGLAAVVLPETLRLLDSKIPTAATALLAPLQAARSAFGRADAALDNGGSDGTARYLVGVLRAAAEGQAAMDQALDIAAQVDPSAIGLLLPAVQKVREAAARMSRALIDTALAAGVSAGRLAPAEEALRLGDAAHAQGQYGPAIGHYADGLGFAADTVVFSMDRFQQNLRSAFDPTTVGWSHALSQGGLLARSGSAGVARTAADPPAGVQLPTRKMHVASVSKTLTTIATLRLLADLGLSPDTAIGNYLPSHWVRGAGVNAITFRELMTHTSGFGQQSEPGKNAPPNSAYTDLQVMVAKGVNDKRFDYANANFGLLRVLSARLLGIDVGSVPFNAADPGALTSAVFLGWTQPLYQAAGVPFSCEPSASQPTLEYRFPDIGTPGYNDGAKSLVCGGYGVFISAQDLARTLAHLRYTNHLLSPASYQAMKAGYLGWMDPLRNYNFAQGTFGRYYTHGGDWDHTGSTNGGLDSCVMVYPINVEAVVLINSSGKESGFSYPHGGYQCSVLKWAFEAAWVMP